MYVCMFVNIMHYICECMHARMYVCAGACGKCTMHMCMVVGMCMYLCKFMFVYISVLASIWWVKCSSSNELTLRALKTLEFSSRKKASSNLLWTHPQVTSWIDVSRGPLGKVTSSQQSVNHRFQIRKKRNSYTLNHGTAGYLLCQNFSQKSFGEFLSRSEAEVFLLIEGSFVSVRSWVMCQDFCRLVIV